MGAKRSCDRLTRVEAGNRLLALSVAGIQRGVDSVRARPWLADAPLAREKLSRMDVDVSLEETVRPRVFVRRPAVHASALPRVDGLPRHPGRLHAPPGDGLLREQPSRNLREPTVRHSESEELPWLWPARLGHHGE